MLSVLRPAVSGSASTLGQRFLVEDSLQTNTRRQAQSLVVASAFRAATASAAAARVSAPSLEIVVKQHPFQEFTKNLVDFFHLLGTKLIGDFLRSDTCYKISDNYALSMVFIYFIRAELTPQEYTRENFFVALYLALDMEDDVEEFKFELFPWCLGKNWKKTYSLFLQSRDRLWKRIDYRALCSKATCDQIMTILPSPIWSRVRSENHGGAIRKCRQPTHPNNDLPVGPFGTPVPCMHCVFNQAEEEKKWNLELDRAVNSSSSNTSQDNDIFLTADEVLSGDSGELFADCKNDGDLSFLDLSLAYRERTAIAIDTEEDEDNEDVDDKNNDDDDAIWGDVSAAAAAAHAAVEDIFAASSEDEEEEEEEEEVEVFGGRGAGSRHAPGSYDDDDDRNGEKYSNIFWDSSQESRSSSSGTALEVHYDPRKAERSFSRINLRDSELARTREAAAGKRFSPPLDLFHIED